MASTFLKDNFKSLSMSEEDKEKLKKFKGVVSDGEWILLNLLHLVDLR